MAAVPVTCSCRINNNDVAKSGSNNAIPQHRLGDRGAADVA
jgi:hypothetical protein